MIDMSSDVIRGVATNAECECFKHAKEDGLARKKGRYCPGRNNGESRICHSCTFYKAGSGPDSTMMGISYKSIDNLAYQDPKKIERLLKNAAQELIEYINTEDIDTEHTDVLSAYIAQNIYYSICYAAHFGIEEYRLIPIIRSLGKLMSTIF